MKKRLLKFASKMIKDQYPEADDIKMDEYIYSIEGFYLTATKMLIIIPLAILLGVFKEMILLLLFFNILRESAFGLHATKSWICLLSSSIVFLGIPFLTKIIVIPFIIKVILGIIGILLIFKYAPADTKKAPIIKEQRRKKLKITSTINCIILTILCLIIKDEIISNIIMFSIWIEIFLILPITYKIFHLSYNNYQTYLLNMN